MKPAPLKIDPTHYSENRDAPFTVKDEAANKGLQDQADTSGAPARRASAPTCALAAPSSQTKATGCHEALSDVPDDVLRAISANPDNDLVALLDPARLARASDDALLAAVRAAFPYEVAILQTANTTVRSGEAELDRTLTGVLAALWFAKGDYERYTRGQPPAVKMTRETFDQARATLPGHKGESLHALIVALMINDLGKSPLLAQKAGEAAGKPLHGNHDEVLQVAVQHGLVPSLAQLSPLQQDRLRRGLRMGSTLNLAQWIQGECPAACLQGVFAMVGHPEAFTLKCEEIFHDVGGARGGQLGGGAFMLEPMAKNFLTGFRALSEAVAQHCTVPQAYRLPFAARAQALAAAGFDPLDLNEPDDFAFLRLLCMGRVETVEPATLFRQAFEGLPATVRQALVDGLNVQGIDDGEAVLPEYMPECFVLAQKALQDDATEKKVVGLQSLMRVLARELGGTKPQPGKAGTVLERSVAFLHPTLKSSAFRDNPAIVESVVRPATAQ